jgi:hypothetical protein
VQIEAARPIVRDLVQVLDWFKANQVRTIARYVTFKDNLLARAEPGWAARHPHTGAIWWDAQNMAWLNPAEPAVWDYHLPLIEEVAQLGFDEILFDALHFPAPDVRGQPQFDQPLTAESRTSAIAGFLSAVRGILTPYPLKIGANVVGYACWRSDDALVGQQLERLAPYLDVIAPLLYPSRLANGIPGCLNPMRCPGDVVYQGTRQAVARLKTAAPGCQVRPWLQDFQDDVFDRRRFGVSEIQAQISGAVRGQAKGFMVWDPQLDYTRAAFQIGAL